MKPWLGAIKAPSDYQGTGSKQNQRPGISVRLEHVHGYRARDCRNNIFLLENNICYFAAGVAIKHNTFKNRQSFFAEHNDDVISMAMSPDKAYFATGELGPKPHIHVISTDTMKLVRTIKGGIIKGVCVLKFSPDSSRLAAVCIDDNHHVAVFDVESGSLLGIEKGDTARILDLAWTSSRGFTTIGLKHLKQWSVSNSGLSCKKGLTSGYCNRNFVIKSYKGSFQIVGGKTGELIRCSNGSFQSSKKVHKGSIDALHVTTAGLVLSGGQDCWLRVLDRSLTLLNEINVNKVIQGSLKNRIRAIEYCEKTRELYLGLYSNEIWVLKLKRGIEETDCMSNAEISQVVCCHYAANSRWTNEIWGLSAVSDGNYLTVSDDRTLRLWSSKERRMLRYLKLDLDKKGQKLQKKSRNKFSDSAKLRSVTICHKNRHIAVGCMDGTVRIVSYLKWKQIKVIKHRKRWISELRYSPDNKYLAVGSHDCAIDIYAVGKKYKRINYMKKHSSFITHLDWSLDSNYLHSNCGAYELLFWDALSGKQLTGGASALRDEEWFTWSCVLGWPV